MKRSLLAVATVGAAVAVLAACQSHNSPTDPTKSEAVQAVDAQNGQVSATATVPGGPGSVPVPGGPGSGGTPPGAPGSGGSGGGGGGTGGGGGGTGGGGGGTGGGGGGSGGGGGGGTTIVPCPTTWFVKAVDTPMPLAAAISNPDLFPPDTKDYEDGCAVKDIKITMWVTTDIGFVNAGFNDYTEPRATVMVCGGGLGFSGCGASTVYDFGGGSASGNQIGTNCNDFVFDTAATTPFDPTTAAAPYSGTYQWDKLRSGVGDVWYLTGVEYEFVNTFRHPPDAVLECARIDVTTQVVTP